MALYRKKPIVIRAVQWRGDNLAGVLQALDVSEHAPLSVVGPILTIITLEGAMQCPVGHWVIKGVAGELYPCDPRVFEMTYEAVS